MSTLAKVPAQALRQVIHYVFSSLYFYCNLGGILLGFSGFVVFIFTAPRINGISVSLLFSIVFPFEASRNNHISVKLSSWKMSDCFPT